MNIGKRLKELRSKRGLSQYSLAKKSGISQSFLSSLELGHKSPTITSLEKICISLGISLAEFFLTDYNEPPSYIKPLVDEARYLSPEQCNLLTNFLTILRKDKR